MALKDFLRLLSDEEARIELEIDEPFKDDYLYSYFWLSDYLTGDNAAKYYNDYVVDSFNLNPEDENSEISIRIKPSIES